MARIPIYQERQQVSQQLTTPDLRAPDANAGAIGRGLQQVGQGLQNLAVGQLRIDTENGKAWAAQAGGEADLTWTQRFKQFQETAKPGAANFTRDVLKDFDPYADELLKTAPDEFSKRFLSEKLSSIRQNLGREAIRFEATESQNNRIFSIEDGITKSAQAVALNPNPAFAQTIIGQNDAIIDSMWLSPTKKEQLKRANRETVSGAYFTVLAKTNPNAVVEMFGGTGAKLSPDNVRDATVEFILKEEGSTYVANDAGAGEAKYGIVAKFNPGVDVKNLTKEQAAKIYREKYWPSAKADQLPPAMAAVMMDTAVNMGPGKADQFLKQSNGDIGVYLNLRRAEYQKLATQDPQKYGQYLNGWMARVDRLEQFAQTGGMGVAKTGNPLIDALPIGKQLEIINAANQNATVANTESVANEVWRDFGPQNDLSPVSEDVMRQQVDALMANRPLAERKVAYDILANRAQVHNRSANQREAASVSGIWEMALTNRSLDEIMQSDNFKDLPGDKKVALMGQLQTFQTKGETLEQQARYLDLISDPQKLAAMTNEQVMALAPSLGQKFTSDALRKKADFNNPEKISAATIDTEDFNMLAAQAGLKPFDAKKSDKEKADLGQLRYAVEQRIYTEQVDKKRPLTREEKVKLMQQELDNKVMVDVTLWKDKQVPISLVKKDDLGKTYVVVEGKDVPLNSIPATSRAMIVRQLRANNLPVTEQAIAEVFVKSRAKPTSGAK